MSLVILSNNFQRAIEAKVRFATFGPAKTEGQTKFDRNLWRRGSINTK